MVKLSSKKTIASKTIEGVTFRVRIASVALRDAYDDAVADIRTKTRDLLQEVEEAKGQNTPEAYRKIIDKQHELEKIGVAISRQTIKWGLVDVDGLEIDGEPVKTPDEVLAKAPFALAQEIYEACAKEAGVSQAEAKNSESPSTSSAAEGGKVTPIIALNASEADGSKSETAASTSQET